VTGLDGKNNIAVNTNDQIRYNAAKSPVEGYAKPTYDAGYGDQEDVNWFLALTLCVPHIRTTMPEVGVESLIILLAPEKYPSNSIDKNDPHTEEPRISKLVTAICAAPFWTRTYHTASTFNYNDMKVLP